MKYFAVGLQIDPVPYEWGLSVRWTCDVCWNQPIAENGHTKDKQTMLYFKRVAIF